MSQEKLLIPLLRKQWVTPLDSLRAIGCMRLASRVHSLRKTYEISSKWVTVGSGKRIKAYRLEGLK